MAVAERPLQITIVSQLDGREIARNQLKYFPEEAQFALQLN